MRVSLIKAPGNSPSSVIVVMAAAAAATKLTPKQLEMLHAFNQQKKSDAAEARKKAALWAAFHETRAAGEAAFKEEKDGAYAHRLDGTTGGILAWEARVREKLGYVPGERGTVSTGYHWVANRGWYKN
jgi:hypothetical protein